MDIVAHIDKDKHVVQDFMCLLKENMIMSVHTMVLNWNLAHSLSIKIKHLKRGFQMKVNCVWSKVELKVDWISGEEINQDV
jgi:hypothetical protein